MGRTRQIGKALAECNGPYGLFLHGVFSQETLVGGLGIALHLSQALMS